MEKLIDYFIYPKKSVENGFIVQDIGFTHSVKRAFF